MSETLGLGSPQSQTDQFVSKSLQTNVERSDVKRVRLLKAEPSAVQSLKLSFVDRQVAGGIERRVEEASDLAPCWEIALK